MGLSCFNSWIHPVNHSHNSTHRFFLPVEAASSLGPCSAKTPWSALPQGEGGPAVALQSQPDSDMTPHPAPNPDVTAPWYGLMGIEGHSQLNPQPHPFDSAPLPWKSLETLQLGSELCTKVCSPQMRTLAPSYPQLPQRLQTLPLTSAGHQDGHSPHDLVQELVEEAQSLPQLQLP